ncbi:MAG TPA: hypothetical protein VIA08_02765 [Nitrososphaeraceae archaeon]
MTHLRTDLPLMSTMKRMNGSKILLKMDIRDLKTNNSKVRRSPRIS